jgi:hypothetical protein
MNPLDLLKVKFQVTTTNPSGNLGKHIWLSLKDIQQSQGWKGLYRGIIPNIAGNASSWGLYFLLCVNVQIFGFFCLDLYFKVITCSKNALPVEILQNHSQRMNTLYVLLKQVRTPSSKKIKSLCSYAIFSSFS